METRPAINREERKEVEEKSYGRLAFGMVNLGHMFTTKLTRHVFQACKASVLLLLPEPTKQRQGRALLDFLLERNPAVVEFNAVIIIQAFADERRESDSRIDGLWMKAANAHPNNEVLHRHWFEVRFLRKDWQGAQKVRKESKVFFIVDMSKYLTILLRQP